MFAIKITEKEFEELFHKYKTDIYRIAYSYVNNQADALDIVQETAYQAYISKDKIKDKSKFKSWLLKIAVNSIHCTSNLADRGKLFKV